MVLDGVQHTENNDKGTFPKISDLNLPNRFRVHQGICSKMLHQSFDNWCCIVPISFSVENKDKKHNKWLLKFSWQIKMQQRNSEWINIWVVLCLEQPGSRSIARGYPKPLNFKIWLGLWEWRCRHFCTTKESLHLLSVLPSYLLKTALSIIKGLGMLCSCSLWHTPHSLPLFLTRTVLVQLGYIPWPSFKISSCITLPDAELETLSCTSFFKASLTHAG